MTSAEWIKLIAELIGLLIGAAGIVVTVKVSIERLSTKVEAQNIVVVELKDEMKKITKILEVQAAHEQRFLNIEQQSRELRQELKELRHGEGFVLPLRKGAHERS